MRDAPLTSPLLIEFGVRGERLRHEGLPVRARQKRKELDVSRGGVMRRPKLLESLALLLDVLGRRIAARLHADVDREPLENSRRNHVRVRLLLGGLPLVPSSRAPKHDIALFRVDERHLAFLLNEEKVELLLVFDEVETDILPGRKPLAKLLAKIVRAQNNFKAAVAPAAVGVGPPPNNVEKALGAGHVIAGGSPRVAEVQKALHAGHVIAGGLVGVEPVVAFAVEAVREIRPIQFSARSYFW